MNSNELDQINRRFDDLHTVITSGVDRIERQLVTNTDRITSLEKTRSSFYGIAEGICVVLSAIVVIAGLIII